MVKGMSSYYTFSEVVRRCYFDVIRDHYFDFRSRARRSEYWFFMLLMTVPMSILYAIGLIGFAFTYSVASDPVLGDSGQLVEPDPGLPVVGLIAMGLMLLWNLFHIIPAFSLTIRRLHDTGRSGWLFLITFIPLVGPLVLLIFMCLDSKPGPNKYGPNPKGVGGSAETEVFD